MANFKRTILIDEPSNEDHFNGKGHERTAVALSKAIANFSGNDRAIGLDGPWGSGKSTVVEIARKILIERKTKDNRDYKFFTFDIWQSQGSSFRRSLLEHLLDWTVTTFPKHRAQLQEVEKKVRGKVRQVKSTNQSILDLWGVLVILALPFLPLYYFWAKAEFDAVKDKIDYVWSYSFGLLVFFVGGTFLWALLKAVFDARKSGESFWKGTWDKYRTALSQTLLIGSKQFEDQKVTQYIREIDPNDFEFQTTLREILSIVQSDKIRVVIVLDNIDRLPKKEINDYWAQVRAVFSGNPAVKRPPPEQCVTAIVPYHRHLVEEQKAPNSDDDSTAPISPLDAREIFTKTFDEILQVSPPVMSNSREFFIEKMGQALPEVSDRDELFRVYLIFDRIIRKQSGSATPRQIIGFINELAGMYVLHGGRFKLPTVAVYIAYQDALEANPGLLNDPKSIEGRVRQIAADSDLEQNLSAMIFNVDPDLALQLMLDQRIKDAAVQGAEKLIEISNSAGFDVRVDQVVQENSDEWDDSGELPVAVANFAALSKVYKGDANRHFRKSLVAAVMQMRRFSFEPKSNQRLLAATELAEAEHLPALVKAMAAASHRGQGGKSDIVVEDGVRWASFLGSLYQKLTDEGANAILPNVLPDITITSNPHFLFGFAARAKSEGISVEWLPQTKIDFEGNEGLFSTYAVDRPTDMAAALAAMEPLKLIDDVEKIAILSALFEQLSQPEIGDMPKFRQQLELAADVYVQIPRAYRANIDASKIFTESPFFAYLVQSLESRDDPVLGSALFLAMQSPGQMNLATPTKATRNGIIADTTEAFASFLNALTAGEEVYTDQFKRIAELHKAGSVFATLLTRGAEQPGNKLADEVIKAGLTENELPYISLSTLNKRYDFLKPLLGEQLNDVLARFDDRIDANDLPKLDISDVNVALLHDVRGFETDGWAKVRRYVGDQLQTVPTAEWPEHVIQADHLNDVLLEMIEGAAFKIGDASFRDVVVQMVVDILAGKSNPGGGKNLDLLLKAIDPSFHGDMYRQVRERARDVTPTSLSTAVRYLPTTISQTVRSVEQLKKDEKDRLVRYFLCAALEGSIDTVLTDFESLGHSKVKDMIAASQESTQEKLHGAMNAFSEPFSNRDRARRLGELFYGKRKVRGMFDIWFGSGE